MRALLAPTAAALLFGCAGDKPQHPPPRPAGPEAPAVTTRPMKLPDPGPQDACGAWKMQYLVGMPRSEIPVPLHPTERRVTCTTCPVTHDHREDRLNILFDAETGIIKQVRCG